MISISRRRGAAAAVAAATVAAGLALTAGAGPAHAAPVPATARKLAGTRPAWARPEADRGATPAGTRVTAQVYLASPDSGRLAAFATAVSTPSSARYRQFLSPARQRADFGPSAAQAGRVESWLRGAGLTVTGATEQAVTVAGPASAIDRAFSTRLRDYALSGRIYYAPSRAAVVPASVSRLVLGVSGLDSEPSVATPGATPATALTGKSVPVKKVTAGGTDSGGVPYVGRTPCSRYWGQKRAAGLPRAYGRDNPLPVCGYLPAQLRSAYGVGKTGRTGRGVTVAVVDAYASSTMLPDANRFARLHGLPAFAPGQYRQVIDRSKWNSYTSCGGPAGWQPEESLDVESVHTMAPGADLVYVGANSCQTPDFMSALGKIVDKRLATIVTNSWNQTIYNYSGNISPGVLRAYTQLFQEGATEGIGFFFSSGDCSTDDPVITAHGLNCNQASSQPQVGFPSSDPWVTAVGATAIGIGAHRNFEWETGMGDSEARLLHGKAWSAKPGTFLFGAGGGTSNRFRQPVYQAGVVPGWLAHTLLTGARAAHAMRTVPDVAMEGDLFASTMVGFTRKLPSGRTGYGEAGYGGTSVASPLFAGIEADAQQGWGSPIGFADPVIYQRDQLAGTPAFYDVTDHPEGKTLAVAQRDGTKGGVARAILGTLGADWTLHATTGYDDVTGVGSPTARYITSFGTPVPAGA